MAAHENDNMTRIGHCLLPIKRFHPVLHIFAFIYPALTDSLTGVPLA
jgi:hypothetical protein